MGSPEGQPMTEINPASLLDLTIGDDGGCCLELPLRRPLRGAVVPVRAVVARVVVGPGRPFALTLAAVQIWLGTRRSAACKAAELL